jgi:hypothetical protein
MIYLIAIFVPPLYFLIKKKWVAGVIHCILCLIALVCTMTIVLAIIGIPLWFVSATCAVWDLRKQLVEEQATVMAQKMAEAMHRPQPPQMPPLS